MGLLGGGNDDSLSASSGWGVLPPINSSSNDWGSSASSSISGVHNNSASLNNNSSSTSGGAASLSVSAPVAAASSNHWMSNTNPNSNGGGGIGGGNIRSAAISVASVSSSSVVGTNSALIADTSTNNQTTMLSSSPKPSSSWAQAAGKGLNTNGPSHDSSSSLSAAAAVSGPSMASTSSSYSNVVLPSSASSSNHHANNGNGNNSTSSGGGGSNSIFQSSSNTSNQFGGLSTAAGSSSAGGSNSFQVDSISLKARNNSSNNISDMIGQMSDDLRETLLTEKWGGQTVINQDSPWNLPPSPQSSPKDSSTWSCSANSGTEIWENAVRQKKGSSSIQLSANNPQLSSGAASKQPWGHPAPTSHIGGTWGDDDNDSNNHWTGVPPSNMAAGISNSSAANSIGGFERLGGGGGGGGGPGGHNSSSINNWSASNGGIGNILSNNSNAHGGLMSSSNSNNNNSQNNFLSNNPNNPNNSHHPHHHQHHSISNAINSASSNSNNWNGDSGHIGNSSGPNTAPVIMGNNNNNNNNVIGNKGSYDSRSGSIASQSIKPPSSWAANYNDHTDSAASAAISDPSFDNFGTWNSDTGMMKSKSEPGWDKDADGKGGQMVDDGTAVWGNPVRQPKSVSNWKDQNKAGNNNQANKIGFANWNNGGGGGNGPNNGQMSANGQSNQMNPNNKPPPQQQQQQQQQQPTPLPPPQQQQQQQSNQLLSRTWTDVAPNHRKSPSLWNDDTKSLNGMATGGGSMTPSNCGPSSNGFGGPGGGGGNHSNWSDGQVDTSNWGGMKHGKPITREMIIASKQFRILADMGFKKEDIENCLRNNQMRSDDALYDLRNMAFDERFKGQNPLNNSALGGNNNGNNSGSNKMQPNNQRQLGSMINAQSNPSQIQNLYQRIQTAVNAGYLNSQILNQQLSNQNLEIIYELLQHINRLQTAQSQVANNGGNAAPHQLKHISQIKQSIVQLQNQLQMHNQNTHGGNLNNNNNSGNSVGGQFGLGAGNNNNGNKSSIHSQQPNDFFKSNNDSLYGAGGGGLNEFGSQGSRLQSWKQSFNSGGSKSQDDKFGQGGNDFIRAPGPISKQHSSSASIGGGGASNWSNFMTDDSGWPPANDHLSSMHHQSKHEKDLAAQSIVMDNEYSLSDSFRVQDYNDGYKPWKASGSGLIPTGKGGVLLDDDSRSLNPMSSLKDPMFSWNNSGAAAPGAKSNNNSLLHNSQSASGAANSVDPLNSFGFNSTWSYSQAPQNSQLFNSAGVVGGSGDLVKKQSQPSSLKSTWGNQLAGSDNYLNSDSLWSGGVGVVGNNNSASVSTISKPRPPPGLSQQVNSSQNKPGSNGNGSSVANNSNNVANSSIWSNSGLSATSAASSSTSEYLRLRNLSPQIDGSTLKTLCFQHGPLHLFHLFLNHGIALARYSNRDQAIKAQSALNNCILSNTTIIADIPSESEVQHYLQLISQQQQQGVNNSSSSSTSSANNSSSVVNHNHSQSQQQQQQSHHHQQHHLSSWSNGTNASQSSAGASASGAQSASSLYRNNSASAGSGGLSFGNSGSNNGQTATTSPASTLPYGSVAGSVLTIAHSTSSNNSTLPYSALSNNNQNNNQQSANNSHVNNGNNHHSSVVGGAANGWNTSSAGANSLWDLQNSNSSGGASLWSTSGFSSQDRNTPIQNFLPGDLLAGDNN